MFKIGDRVKPRYPKWKYGDGVVINIDGDNWIQVKYNTSACVICDSVDCSMAIGIKWHRPIGIEHVIIKNQQLEFNFMNS